uniref:Uncharacterized protein n=1 Tax=Brassica oleracea var. oleracea TaxID=109376 RepID=A0A0D3D4Q2_BRAOL
MTKFPARPLRSSVDVIRRVADDGILYGLCKLAGFLKTLEYWPRDKFWDLVSGCLILCLEMLGTSALGLGQDLGLLLLLEGAMTNSTYVSRFSFILIPYLFRVRDRCFAMLQGFSLSPAFEKHFGLTTDVRNQNCCSCLDTNNLICDRGIRTEVSRKICPWEEAFSFIVLCEVLAFRDLFRAFLRMFRIALEVWLGVKDVFTHIAQDVVGQGLDQGTLTFKVVLVYDRVGRRRSGGWGWLPFSAILSFVFPDIVLIKRYRIRFKSEPRDRTTCALSSGNRVLVIETEHIEDNAAKFLSAESSESKKLSLVPLA